MKSNLKSRLLELRDEPSTLKGCCACCCGVTLIVFAIIFAVIAAIIVIIVKIMPAGPMMMPNFSIDQFEVLALNKYNATNSTNNNIINYNIKLNPLWRFDCRGGGRRVLGHCGDDYAVGAGSYYDALDFAFYYKPNLTSTVSIGNVTYPAFYHKGSEVIRFIGFFNVSKSGVSWENAKVGEGLVLFRVDVNTSVRFNLIFSKTKPNGVTLGADVHVNDHGELAETDKGTKLTSGASKL